MISHQQLKIYRSLKQKKYRHRERKFLIEGLNLCEAALQSDFLLERLLLSRDGELNFSRHLPLLAEKRVPVEIVPDKVIRSLSESTSPQGIIAVVKMPLPALADLWKLPPREILVLDRVRDPGNLGTILRTANWFGIPAIACSNACVDLYNSKVLRSSAGSLFQLPLILDDVNLTQLLPELLEHNYNLFVANPAAQQSYLDVEFRRPFALIVGSERQGVEKAVYSFPLQEICIPRRGRAESLNVAMATAILLAAATKVLRSTTIGDY